MNETNKLATYRRKLLSIRGRRRVPTVLQMEAVECGAACAGMILAFHGRHVALEELRIACGVSRDGSKASNIVRAARRYGLEARGLRTEPAMLAQLPRPVILHWNFNHFVVLEEIRRGHVFLNDPAHGPRRVSQEELDQAFTGIALTFRPGPEFRPSAKPEGALGALLARLRGSRGAVAFVVLLALLLVGPGLLTPAFSKVFVDEILVGEAIAWMRPLLFAMLLAITLTFGLTFLQREFLLRFETRLAVTGAANFIWHVLRLPISFFAQRYGGEVGARAGINDRIATILSGDLAVSFVGALTVAFYAAAMLRYDVWMGTVGLLAAAMNVVFLYWMGRERKDANQRLLQERGKLMGVAMGGLQTIETLKASGTESDFFSRWAGHHAKMLNAQQYLGVRAQLLAVAPPALAALASATVLGLGASRVIDGRLTMGALVAFQGLLAGFLSPVGRFVALGGTLQESHGDMRRLQDVLNARTDVAAVSSRRIPESASPGCPPRSLRLTGRITLDNVVFGYSPLDAPLIDGLSLDIVAGECVALVGGSGSGKSTLARLICGLYVPWHGQVLFDGTPRDEHDPLALATSIGYVDQEIFLFEGTVRENIALWDETVPEPSIVAAAKDACLHDTIAVRAGGYRALVEEAGRNFSGGQRQRMEIARALSARPSVLVMDEATSALDAETERIVSENVRRRGCTCVIVAHRLSAVRDADRIIVLEKGRIVEEGAHDVLVEQNGPYRRLMELA